MMLAACAGLQQSITFLKYGSAASNNDNHLPRHVPQDLLHGLPGINLHLPCNAGPLQVPPTAVRNIAVQLQWEQCHLQGRVQFR